MTERRSSPRPAGPSSSARRVLRDGVLCYLAVRTTAGPHVTPVVYVLDGGRLWFTTARSSVKSRVWRRDPWVSGLVMDHDRSVTFRAPVRTYDAFDPLSWPGAVATGPRLMRAATRFSLKNARFFAGYAVDAGKVPLAWTPPGRVFASARIGTGAVLEPGAVSSGWGRWPGRFESRRSFAPRSGGVVSERRVPSSVRRAVGTSGRGVLAVEGGGEVTVLPAVWCRADTGVYEAAVPSVLLRLAGAGPSARAALVIDRVSRWRAAEMSGMLLRGRADLFDPAVVGRGRSGLRARLQDLDAGDDHALVRIGVDRVVWWEGWTSGTVLVS